MYDVRGKEKRDGTPRLLDFCDTLAEALVSLSQVVSTHHHLHFFDILDSDGFMVAYVTRIADKG